MIFNCGEQNPYHRELTDEEILKGNIALGVSFVGYFIGNIGLGLVAK